MLLIVAVTAVNDVTKPIFSKEIANTENAKITINVIKYTLVARTTSCSTGLPSILIFRTLRG